MRFSNSSWFGPGFNKVCGLVMLVVLTGCQTVPQADQSPGSQTAAGQSVGKPAQQSVASQSAEGQSAGSQSLAGQSAAEQSAANQSASGQSVTQPGEQSVANQSAASQSLAGQSAAEQSAANQSASGQSVTQPGEQSVANQSAASQSLAGQSAAEQSAANQSAAEQSVTQPGEQSVASQSAANQSVDQGEPKAWSERKRTLQKEQTYLTKGRVSVAFGDQVQQGDFRLEVNRRHYQLRLSGPFGLGAVELVGDDESVVMSSARHGRIEIDNPDQELRKYLGYSIPLSAIKHWVLGVPERYAPARENIDHENQRLESLQQLGWSVKYRQYREFGGEILPRKVDIQRDDVKIRMLFSTWQLDQ